MARKNNFKIISYNTLEDHQKKIAIKNRVKMDVHNAIVASHMALQERNEELRIKNSKLIGIISNTKNAINGKS